MNLALFPYSTAAARNEAQRPRERKHQELHKAKCLDWKGALLVWSRSGLLAPAGELMNAQDLIYYLDSDI